MINAQNFSSTVLNPGAGPGWSLAAGATVDPAGNVYFSWTAYPRTNILTRPVKVFVSRSADGGRNWSTTPMDVSTAGAGLLGSGLFGWLSGLPDGSGFR